MDSIELRWYNTNNSGHEEDSKVYSNESILTHNNVHELYINYNNSNIREYRGQ